MAMTDTLRHVPITLSRALKNEARSTEEDWSGLASSAERRKIQNRINARAYRKRKSQLKKGRAEESSESSPELESSIEDPACFHMQDIANRHGVRVPKVVALAKSDRDRLLSSPTIDQLLTLIYYNVFRAFMSNIELLGYSHDSMCEEECQSIFTRGDSGDHLPLHMRPTSTQKTISHHPMFDIFPDPKLRDEMIVAQGMYNEYEMCMDIMGEKVVEGDSSIPPQGLIVWGEPWRIESWEMTEQFVAKWFCLVSGCVDLINASNRWRAERGESPLVVEELA